MPDISAIRSPAVEDLVVSPVRDARAVRPPDAQPGVSTEAFRQRIDAILDPGLRPATEVTGRPEEERPENARAIAPTPAERQQAARATEAALESEPLQRPFEGRGVFDRGGGRRLLSEVVDQINGRFDQFQIAIGFEVDGQTDGNVTSLVLRDLNSQEEITTVNANRLFAIQRQIEDALSIPGTSELPPGLFLDKLFL